jgi:hypothetical protein
MDLGLGLVIDPLVGVKVGTCLKWVQGHGRGLQG